MDTPDIAGRKALLGWLADHLNTITEPAQLWHYTDAAGLSGIVQSQRLWATNARFLNDSAEIEHGTAVMAKALGLVDSASLQTETRRFVSGLADPATHVLDTWAANHLEVFVACFCEDGDRLSQWRAYGGADGAGGYSLGLGTRRPLGGWVQTAGSNGLYLRPVIYDERAQLQACENLIQALLPVLDFDPTDTDRQNAFSRHLVDGITEVAAWMKHPAFAEEREWRITYVPANDVSGALLPVRHRPAQGLLVPYVELHLPAPVGVHAGHLPLREINCGPGRNPRIKVDGVRSLLRQTTHLGGVSVTSSATPLRLL